MTPGPVATSALTRLAGAPGDYDPLLEWIGARGLVLLGESSHGTHEFYAERAALTRRLIEERGFRAVAVEADWPDAYRAHRYVMGRSGDPDATAALGDFRRFPSWMWGNQEVVEFLEWLRAFNAGRADADRVGFYGLDLYSLHASMTAVVDYLDLVDPAAAREARERYSCFELVSREGADYGHAVATGAHPSCEDDVVDQLVELRARAVELVARDGLVARDDFFVAEQNARVARNAERYYRALYQGRVSTWNLRDEHMADTLRHLVAHLEREGGRSKVVVWEHNSHVGDARATELSRGGEINVGQLVRTTWGDDAYLVGFTTFSGQVSAASTWGGPVERRRVRPALAGSVEALLHRAGLPAALVRLGEFAPPDLRDELLERAIGVIYRPETERASHWFHARVDRQFDALIHVDHTSAVRPLETTSLWEEGEEPETYPTGL